MTPAGSPGFGLDYGAGDPGFSDDGHVVKVTVTFVPEPGTAALVLVGLALLAWLRLSGVVCLRRELP